MAIDRADLFLIPPDFPIFRSHNKPALQPPMNARSLHRRSLIQLSRGQQEGGRIPLPPVTGNLQTDNSMLSARIRMPIRPKLGRMALLTNLFVCHK